MLLYSTVVSLLTVDGCKNYTVLSEADRAQGHIVINASNYRCDRDDLVPGWYRFQGAVVHISCTSYRGRIPVVQLVIVVTEAQVSFLGYF